MSGIDTPIPLPKKPPTWRDLATAFYLQRRKPTCYACLRYELGGCPHRKGHKPARCLSFQLNSELGPKYGRQASDAMKAWRTANLLHDERISKILNRSNGTE